MFSPLILPSNIAETTLNPSPNSNHRTLVPLPTPSYSLRDLSTQFMSIDPFPKAQEFFYDVYKGVLFQDDAEVPVAVKIFRISVDEHKNALMHEQYLREIQANEFIGPDYTHITEVIGTATIGGKPAIVMRWYTNGDVAQYTSLNPHSLVDLIISIVQGVKHLHTNDLWVVHSDLQPSNILVDDDGRALISGLGLIYVPGNTVFTTANMSGPCQWMAPEHIVVDEDHNAQPPAPTFQSTMWAVGCTIARLITGKVPYQSRRYSPQVVPLIVRGVLPYIKAGFVDAADAGGVLRSEELWQVLDQCWEKDPTRRPTITQFEASIQGVFDIS